MKNVTGIIAMGRDFFRKLGMPIGIVWLIMVFASVKYAGAADVWVENFVGTGGAQVSGWSDDTTDSGFNANLRYAYVPSYAVVTRTAASTWGKVLAPAQTCDVSTYSWVEVNIVNLSAGATWKVGIQEIGGAWAYQDLNTSSSSTGTFAFNYQSATGWSGTKTFAVQLVVEGASGEYMVTDWVKVFDNTPTPTITATHTHTPTLTVTPTATFTGTTTPTPTVTFEDTSTQTETPTCTSTATPSASATSTPSVTITGTSTGTATLTPTFTATATMSSTETNSPTITTTPTDTVTPTVSITATSTATITQTSTETTTPTQTATLTASTTETMTFTVTPTPTESATPSMTPTATPTSTYTPTVTASHTITHTPTVTMTSTSTPTWTPSATITPTTTPTPTWTVTVTGSPTETMTCTITETATVSPTPTASPSTTMTSTITPTHTSTTTAQPSDNLDQVVVFPNPYFDSKAYFKQINFIHLTYNARVRVFTLSGELVWEKEKNDGSDRIRWEGVVNRSGQKLASGVYIYIVTNVQGQKRSGKLAVVR